MVKRILIVMGLILAYEAMVFLYATHNPPAPKCAYEGGIVAPCSTQFSPAKH